MSMQRPPSPTDLRDEATASVLNHNYNTGALLLVAGPGTGKTHNLIETIRYQLAAGTCDLDGFFAVSLTNAIVRDFQGETQKRVDPAFEGVSTLHFRAKGIVHEHCDVIGWPADFGVLSACEEYFVVREIKVLCDRDGLQIDGRALKRLLREYRGLSASLQDDLSCFGSKFSSLQRFYKTMDWYDLVKHACFILQNSADALEIEAGRMSFLLIDEYQDLNIGDRTLAKLLNNGRHNLLVVGDPAQSIYSGRYSDPTGIVSFIADYPDAKQIPLPVCSRCPSSILTAAHSLISCSTDFVPDAALTAIESTEARTGGGMIASVRLAGSRREAAFYSQALRLLQDKGISPSRVLVLVSNKDMGKLLLDQVLEADGELMLQDSLSKDPVEPDIGSYLVRFISDNNDNLALSMLLHLILRIGFDKMAVLLSHALDSHISLWEAILARDDLGLSHQCKSSLTKWVELCEPLLGQDAIAALRAVGAEYVDFQEILETRAAAMEKQDIDVVVDPEEERIEPESPITGFRFMTLHASKGLAADYIFIPFLEAETVLPACDENEQRRLLYVGFTRAKCAVVCTWARARPSATRYGAGGGAPQNRNRSEFLAEAGITHDTDEGAALNQLSDLCDHITTFDNPPDTG